MVQKKFYQGSLVNTAQYWQADPLQRCPSNHVLKATFTKDYFVRNIQCILLLLCRQSGAVITKKCFFSSRTTAVVKIKLWRKQHYNDDNESNEYFYYALNFDFIFSHLAVNVFNDCWMASSWTCRPSSRQKMLMSSSKSTKLDDNSKADSNWGECFKYPLYLIFN